MAFDVAGSLYQRFMGQYSDLLSGPFADVAGVTAGSRMRVLDVGCGPGALTEVLQSRVGAAQVVGVDPSAPFVAAVRERLPDVDVRQASAEALPFQDGEFDAALAQLVVLFMQDPAAGVAEMARVTRPGGVVALAVWDHASGRGPLTRFWTAVRALWPEDYDLDERGTSGSALTELLDDAGLTDVSVTELTVRRQFETFEEWWEPHTLGVGPVGDYYRSLSEERRTALRAKASERTPELPFVVEAVAVAARGVR